MFAAFPGVAEKLAALAIKCLAVGGGFLAGYLLGGLIVFALARWVFSQKAPDGLKKTIQILTGLALAILVAIIVFGDGSGGGMFGGGAEGEGKGTPDANSDAKDKGDKTPPPVTPPDKTPPKVDVPKKKPDIPVDSAKVRVVFYGGEKAGIDRFYQLDDDPNLKTFQELQEAVLKRKREESRPIYLEIDFPPDRTAAAVDNSITVSQVLDWAEKSGIEYRRGGKK